MIPPVRVHTVGLGLLPAFVAAACSGAENTSAAGGTGGAGGITLDAASTASTGSTGGNGAASGGGGGSGGGEPSMNECESAGAEKECYEGDAVQAGVGACVYGKRACEQRGEFLVWGPCTGSGSPSNELCGDTLDSDCDGNNDNGCLACDGVSPLFDDPFMDGSLRLKKAETAGFDLGPHKHSWICAQESAAIHLCSDTTIELSGGQPTVIGGLGLVPFNIGFVTVKIVSTTSDPIWVRLDSTKAVVAIEVDAPNAKFSLTNYGNSNDVWLSGTAKSFEVAVQNQLIINKPIKCSEASSFKYVNFIQNAANSCGGTLTGGSTPPPLTPPFLCP